MMIFFSFHFLSFRRKNHLFFTIGLTGLIAFSTPTMAQVSVNNSALDHLGGTKKNTTHHTTNTHKTHSKHTTHTTHTQPKTVPTTTPAQPQQPVILPTIPKAPPPRPVFKDADIVVPLHPPVPPPMPKVDPKAKGEAQITSKHTLIIFDRDSIDLNDAMMKAIMDFADMLKRHPNNQVYLNAYSHGTADDPSTQRRTALNRGLVIRAVLINQGIPTTKIYLLAKGVPEEQVANLSPDHVEMIRSDLMTKKQAKVEKK